MSKIKKEVNKVCPVVPEKEKEKEVKNKESITPDVSPVEQDLIEIQKESTLDKSYSQLYGDKNLLKLTEVSDNDMGDITIILTYAKKFGFIELTNLVETFLKLKVSRKRMGREEHVKVSQAELIREQEHLKFIHGLDRRVEK